LELYQHATHSRINPSIFSSSHPLALPASIQNNLIPLKNHALKKKQKPTKNRKKEKIKKTGKGGENWKRESNRKWRSNSTRNKLMKKKKLLSPADKRAREQANPCLSLGFSHLTMPTSAQNYDYQLEPPSPPSLSLSLSQSAQIVSTQWLPETSCTFEQTLKLIQGTNPEQQRLGRHSQTEKQQTPKTTNANKNKSGDKIN
jgi:hypothetical protein